MFNTVEVAKKIRTARLAKNMTQMALADEMGVSFQAVSNWERGNSLPDIGKLPDLCRILDISLTELLGEEQKETKTVEKLINEEEVPLEDLADVAPMLPPEQVESSFRRAEKDERRIDIQTLLALAPFLDDEYLDGIADRVVVEDVNALILLAPYLSEETLDRMAVRLEGSAEASKLSALAPFLSDKTLDRMAEKLSETSFDKLVGLAPVLREETLDRMTDKLLAKENGSLKDVIALAPFLSSKNLRKVADRAIRQGDIGTLKNLSHFL